MCRWMCYFGEPTLVADVLSRPVHSIIQQSTEHYLPDVLGNDSSLTSVLSTAQRNHVLNLDGAGIGFFLPITADPRLDPQTPGVLKIDKPPGTSAEFDLISRKTIARCVFVHVRAASPGLSISINNVHPFKFGPLLWMHNGGIANFTRVLKVLITEMSDHAISLVKGTTDSEWLGAFTMDSLHGPHWQGDFKTHYTLEELHNAVESAIRRVIQILKSVSSKEHQCPPCSLNVCLGDGNQVVATRFRNCSRSDPPSLYTCRAKGLTVGPDAAAKSDCELHVQAVKQGDIASMVFIASEPLTFDKAAWKMVPRNSIVSIHNDRTVTIKKLVADGWQLEWQHAAKSVRRMKKKTLKPPSSPQAQAATKIQALFRGMSTRKMIQGGGRLVHRALAPAGNDMVSFVRSQVYGLDVATRTPFGLRRITYSDYTASGKPLKVIETYLSDVVYPTFANTHTETSFTGFQTTHFREEARLIIMDAIHADSERYALIFCGSGSTAAFQKLTTILGCLLPEAFGHLELAESNKPVVINSEMEHHSNELPWREGCVIMETVKDSMDEQTGVDLAHLETLLKKHADRKGVKLVSLSAGSNVTGIVTPMRPVAKLAHKYGFLCFADFAGCGPYIKIRIAEKGTAEDECLDGGFFSPHKFPGGPGTPGFLVMRRSIYENRRRPTMPGGGTVRTVLPSEWFSPEEADCSIRYSPMKHPEVVEEAGTPAIIESIRCGLAFKLKQMVGEDQIEELEMSYATRAIDAWSKHPLINLVGANRPSYFSPHRLSITSFNIKAPRALQKLGYPLLHPHFVAALLNDVYGIQARSGCACAGPYGVRLMIGDFGEHPLEFSKLDALNEKRKPDYVDALKIGFARVNFNYFIGESEFDFIVKAVLQIAEHGWKLLPLYSMQAASGSFVHVHDPRVPLALTDLTINASDGTAEYRTPTTSNEDPCEYLDAAMSIYSRARELAGESLSSLYSFERGSEALPNEFDQMRWFPLAKDAVSELGLDAKKMADASGQAVKMSVSTAAMTKISATRWMSKTSSIRHRVHSSMRTQTQTSAN